MTNQGRTHLLSTLLSTLVWIALVAATPFASAADLSVYREGDIEVSVTTTSLPAAFAGQTSDPDWQWFGVRMLITKISVNVGKKHTVLPTRAYLGMADPGSVKIKHPSSKGRWTLTITGGDASTAYRTVMEFVGSDVRTVKEFGGESGSTRPYVTEMFAPIEVLN